MQELLGVTTDDILIEEQVIFGSREVLAILDSGLLYVILLIGLVFMNE